MDPTLTRISLAAIVMAALTSLVLADSIEEPNWQRSQEFDEQSFTATVDPKIRIHVSAPLDDKGQPAKATRLIVFALPNGNTLEQTLGCQKKDGLDWHYDIQHIAAQTRMLRTLEPQENVVLVCAEAPGLSWPSFRKNVSDANTRIAKLVDDWRTRFGTDKTKVTLTGHSGGGAFMFGVIDGNAAIPAYIDRVAFLDANYSFNAALHAKKIENWLNGDDQRRFIIVCYDDREIMLNGKKVVGPDGGTFRATGRTHDALGKAFELTDSVHEPFRETTGLDGRIHFYIHPNPENKILHTALVGEMNGLLQVATLGTPNEGKWGTFGGPRAYIKYVQAGPTPNAASAATPNKDKPAAGAAPIESAKTLRSNSQNKMAPPRPATAIGGAEFSRSIASLSLKDREAAIFREITSGNFPEFLRTFKAVEIHGPLGKEKSDVTALMEVMPDYLAVGSDTDFVRMPMTPQTAQKIADRFGCVLPTRKIVDAIDAQAEFKVAPHPMTEAREAVATFVEHNRIIEKQRAAKPLGLLTIGTKKDIVLTPRIFEKPNRLAIYGWRQLNGQPIQPLTIVHWNGYVDYSHGVRLVRDTLQIDGKRIRIADILADDDRAGLVSDEGSMKPPRYPTE